MSNPAEVSGFFIGLAHDEACLANALEYLNDFSEIADMKDWED